LEQLLIVQFVLSATFGIFFPGNYLKDSPGLRLRHPRRSGPGLTLLVSNLR